MDRYFDIAFSPAARRHQERRGSYEYYDDQLSGAAPNGLGLAEIEFLSERDSFYLASVGPDGWPYLQHRGGPAGFVKVVDPTHVLWADRSGNKQYISAGNIDSDGRVSIIAVDYPNRRRLKLYGRATFDPHPDPIELERLGLERRMEGLVRVEVVSFDWNCPKFITPRFTAAEVEAAAAPLHRRIADLEAEVALLRPQRPPVR